MTASSFGGVGFDFIVDRYSEDQEADVNERHIPGGNTTYFDLAGQKARHVKGVAWCPTLATYNSLRGLQGSTGTLSSPAGTFSAVLIRCGLSRVWNSGVAEAPLDFAVT